MRLTDDLKAKLNNAKSEAEVKAILDEIKGGVKDAGLELTDAELENSFPLGVSNEWAEDAATVSITDGTLLIVLSKL